MIRIETQRLTLRPMEPRDVEAHITMMADPDVARFLAPDGALRPRAEEWRLAATIIGHWAIRGYGFFSVEEKSSGAWIGRVGPWQPDGWPGLECGWSIARPYWGRGYASEAAKAAIAWMFATDLALARVISVIDPKNAASQGVARAVGETRTDEVFHFRGFELDVWAVTRDAFLARQNPAGETR